MRGAEANHVLVLIDGIEANDPSLGDETSWASLSAADVQRIEVLRGVRRVRFTAAMRWPV